MKTLAEATPEEMAQELDSRKRTFVLCHAEEGTRRLLAFSGNSGVNMEMMQMAANEMVKKVMADMPSDLKPPVKQGVSWLEEELAKP